MALDALGVAAARIMERDADIFIGEGSFTNPVTPDTNGNDPLYHLGSINQVNVNGTARETEPDSHGNTHPRGYDLEITWNVMQTDYSVEFAELGTLFSKKLMVKVTDSVVEWAEGVDSAATQENMTAAAVAAAGIEFENAKIVLGFSLDFNGGNQYINATIRSRLGNDDFSKIGNEPIVLS